MVVETDHSRGFGWGGGRGGRLRFVQARARVSRRVTETNTVLCAASPNERRTLYIFEEGG